MSTAAATKEVAVAGRPPQKPISSNPLYQTTLRQSGTEPRPAQKHLIRHMLCQIMLRIFDPVCSQIQMLRQGQRRKMPAHFANFLRY
jgi:hypothetical protein